MYIVPKFMKKIVGYPSIKHTSRDVHTKIDSFSVIINCSIGAFSYVGEHSSVIDTEIGKYCSISNYCAIGGGEHPMNWISTSPVFNSSKSILRYRLANAEWQPFRHTIIGNDVWIGSHVLIKGGINIGTGAVIGMGSVVTQDVGEYEIWAGNPAKIIRKRFDDDIVKMLVKSKWWEMSEREIRNYAPFFSNIESVERIFNKLL